MLFDKIDVKKKSYFSSINQTIKLYTKIINAIHISILKFCNADLMLKNLRFKTPVSLLYMATTV